MDEIIKPKNNTNVVVKLRMFFFLIIKKLILKIGISHY